MLIDRLAFHGPHTPYKTYTMKCWYLHEPKGKALVKIFKGLREADVFLWPAYKIFNLQHHFEEIVDRLEANRSDAYDGAGWSGL
jgi:hypothetical protein